jgi:HlyD family secretion protein
MKKIQNFIKKHRWLTAIIILIVVAAVVYAVITVRKQASAAATYQTEVAARGTLTATIGATGTVRSSQMAILSWQTNGTVGAINVQTGDLVKAGDVLAAILPSSLAQNIILAKSDLVNAQRNLDELMNSDKARANAQLTLANAQKAYETAKANKDRLTMQRADSSTVDYYQAQYDLALQRVDQAQEAYDATNGLSDANPTRANAYTNLYNAMSARDKALGNLNWMTGKPTASDEALTLANFAVAEANLKDAQREWDRLKDGPDPNDIAAAQARVDAAQAALAAGHVAAPFDGTITEINSMVGDQVTPGVRAFRIDDLFALLVDVQVSEVDINSVQVGQPVAVTFDAILDTEYHGKVVEVAQAGDVAQGLVTFTVTVQLTDVDEQIKPGMTAAVTITVKQLENVLLVPNRAVRVVNNQRVVYILQNGQPVEVKITLGATSDTYSEVIGGDLKEGDEIILNPPTIYNPSGGGPFGN